MPEPKWPCPHCSRLVGSRHYAGRSSCFLAEKLSIRNSQTSQSNLPNWSNDVADTISSPDPHHLNATRPNLDNDVNEYAADIDFDSNSNAVVSSSIGNVGPGEPSANQFQSTPGLGNLDSDEVKAIPGPETLDAQTHGLFVSHWAGLSIMHPERRLS